MGLVAVLCVCFLAAACADHVWTDQWVMSFNGSLSAAEDVAREHGFTLLGKVSPGVYHLKYVCPDPSSKCVPPHMPTDSHTHRLRRAENMNWVYQHHRLDRTRRADKHVFTDPMWSSQWYMNSVKQISNQINVISVWDKKITGKDVVVTVVDDGIEHDHPDLAANYDALASWDMNDNDPDPYPNVADPINSHGTRCCGQIAMALNNGFCGIGVAYNARIGGVRFLDGEVTDSTEARSLSLQPQHIDIYTNSWGPNDDGATMEAPGPLAQAAFEDGVRTGRGGLGSIYLFANGNGGAHDDCNADGYANSLYTIAIGAIAEDGSSPWYTEQCAATMAVTFSSGGAGQRAISSVDIHHGCTSDHTGTSAASPMAAGILALALEANPKLNWRDVQHLIARTSQKTAPQDPAWTLNGAGLPVNPKFGFGRLDAGRLVDAAAAWVSVGPQLVFTSPLQSVNKVVPRFVNAGDELQAVFVVDEAATVLRTLEHVQVAVNIDADRRGDIEVELVSPAGTRSALLSLRAYDNDVNGIHWTFMTVRCWGESALGTWTLAVRSHNMRTTTLLDWTLILYGTEA